MEAVVSELGERPQMFTPARAQAPQAAVALAKMFEQPGHRWADKAEIVLDWQNQLMESDDPELQYPVMVISCNKHVPEKGFLVVTSRLNIENVFTGDYVTPETLAGIVEEFRILTLTKLDEAGVR